MSQAATALPLSSEKTPENSKPKAARAGVETLSHASGIIGLADAGTQLEKWRPSSKRVSPKARPKLPP
jgi:hypothetical protein